MKFSFGSYVLAAATLWLAGGSPLLASRETPPRAWAHPIQRVEHHNGSAVSRGSSLEAVRQALGEPARKLAPDLWIYPRYDGGSAQSRDDDCSLLMVCFHAGRVADLQLINARAERVYAARVPAAGAKSTRVAGP